MAVLEAEITVLVLLSVVVAVVNTGETWLVKTKACPQGCNSCSLFNGCITCKPRYLLLLHRTGMKQVGYCRRTCPSGYYASRAGDMSRCFRCRVDNCESCFSRGFCVRCQPPYYAYDGKCYARCPENTWGDSKTGSCLESVDCEVSDWGSWSECQKNDADCGYKWGLETRLRGIILHPTPGGKPCPELSETRECRMLQRYCPDDGVDPVTGKRKKKGDSKNRRKTRRKGRRRSRPRKTRTRTRRKSAPNDQRRDRTKSKPRTDTESEVRSSEISLEPPADLLATI